MKHYIHHIAAKSQELGVCDAPRLNNPSELVKEEKNKKKYIPAFAWPSEFCRSNNSL